MSKQFTTYKEAWAFARKVSGEIGELEKGYLVVWEYDAVPSAPSPVKS